LLFENICVKIFKKWYGDIMSVPRFKRRPTGMDYNIGAM
jgi:hypothetical protein